MDFVLHKILVYRFKLYQALTHKSFIKIQDPKFAHSLHFHFTSLSQWGAKEAGRTRMVPSGLPDTAFASRVRPRALRALRRAGLAHLRKMTQKSQKKVSKRAPSPAKTEVLHENIVFLLLKKTSQPRKKLKFCMKNGKKTTKKGTKKSTQPRKNWSFAWKKKFFFTQKNHPASQKTKFLHKKMTKKWLKFDPKKQIHRHESWSFGWKI